MLHRFNIIVLFTLALLASVLLSAVPAHAAGNVDAQVTMAHGGAFTSRSLSSLYIALDNFYINTNPGACGTDKMILGVVRDPTPTLNGTRNYDYFNACPPWISPLGGWNTNYVVVAIYPDAFGCPANSAPTGQTCTCIDPAIPNGNHKQCLTPSFQGSNAVSVCTASGCNSSAYTSAQAACDSYSLGNAVPTLVTPTICKVVTTFSDGTTSTVYHTLNNTNACSAGDVACQSALNATNAANASSVYASNVNAVSTQAGTAAYNAAIAQGASSAVAAADAQTAAANAAANYSTSAFGGSGAGGAGTPSLQLPTDYNREMSQLKILADLDKMAAASGTVSISGIPPDLARQSDVQAVVSAVKALNDTMSASGVPADISVADAQKLSDAEAARKQFQADILAIPNAAAPVPPPSLFNPFVPAACAPLSFTFGSALTVGLHTVTFDICPQVPVIQRIVGFALYLLTAVLLFQMFTRRPEGSD